MSDRITITRVSENSFLVRYHEQFSTELSVHIARCAEELANHFSAELLNVIPSYEALLITFQPWVDPPNQNQINEALLKVSATGNPGKTRVIELPTYYHDEVAEHLNQILTDTGCTLDELITHHTAQPYFVYMIGFCPGFGYMGELPQKIRLPRRQVPQLKIAAGSVAIAEFQTAVYPIEMPGGWHVIGRTPTKVFDACRREPSLFKQGDLVQFRPISREEFLRAGGTL